MEHNYQSANTVSKIEMQSAQWFEDFKNGSDSAYSKLYDAYLPLMYNYGYRLTTDMELLKDCIQEVFVKIYNKRADLGNVLNFKSYIIISLKNKLCDESRKRVHLSDLAVDELDVISPDHVEKNYLAAEQERTDNAMVGRLMSFLSPRQRKAIELYYIEERKYEDICDILEMNYQSVRNLIHRGMTKLRSVGLQYSV